MTRRIVERPIDKRIIILIKKKNAHLKSGFDSRHDFVHLCRCAGRHSLQASKWVFSPVATMSV